MVRIYAIIFKKNPESGSLEHYEAINAQDLILTLYQLRDRHRMAVLFLLFDV